MTTRRMRTRYPSTNMPTPPARTSTARLEGCSSPPRPRAAGQLPARGYGHCRPQLARGLLRIGRLGHGPDHHDAVRPCRDHLRHPDQVDPADREERLAAGAVDSTRGTGPVGRVSTALPFTLIRAADPDGTVSRAGPVGPVSTAIPVGGIRAAGPACAARTLAALRGSTGQLEPDGGAAGLGRGGPDRPGAEVVDARIPVGLVQLLHRAGGEIGRASCRERV